MTNLMKNLALLPILMVVANCQVEAPPAPPSRLSSDDAASGDAKSKELPAATKANDELANVALKFGAAVGTRQQRQKVNACNEKGMFFDRVKDTCSTTLTLVKGVECNREALLTHYDVGTDGMQAIDTFIASQNGVKFYYDQCVQTDPVYWTIYMISDAMKSVSVCVAAPGPCPK